MVEQTELIGKAKACLQNGQVEEAIALYEQAFPRQMPEEVELLSMFAVAYHQVGQLKKAVAHYGRFLSQTPNAPTTLVLRGAALLDLHRYQNALKDFNEAIRLSPYLEDAYWGRGQVFAGLNDYGWAVVNFSRAIELDPNAAEYYEARAAALRQLGRLTEANQDVQKATELRSP